MGRGAEIASMPADYTPLYFASAILPDGRMIVGAAVHGENAASWSQRPGMYNPVSNSWASVDPPRGWTNMGDAASDVLADGTFMLQQPCNTCLTNPDLTVDDALLNAKNLTWRVIPAYRQDRSQRRRGLDARAERPAAHRRHVGIGQHRAVQPARRRLELRRRDGRGRQPGRPVPGRRDRPAFEMPGGNAFMAGTSARNRRRRAPMTKSRRRRSTRTRRAPGAPAPRSRPSTTRSTEAPNRAGKSCRTGTCYST